MTDHDWRLVSDWEAHARWCIEAGALDFFREVYTTDREGKPWVVGPCLHGYYQEYPAPNLAAQREAELIRAQERRRRATERRRRSRA